MSKKTIAQLISRIFDPAVLGVVILLVAIGKSPMNYTEMFAWLLVIVILNGLVPLLFLIYFTNHGYVFDDVLTNSGVHQQRIRLFLVFWTVVAVELLVLVSTPQYQPLLAVFTGGLIAATFAVIITRFWKISLHSALATFFVAMLIFIYGTNIWPVILFIPLVFWSRMYLHRHTFWQLSAGMLMAFFIILATFYMYGLI